MQDVPDCRQYAVIFLFTDDQSRCSFWMWFKEKVADGFFSATGDTAVAAYNSKLRLYFGISSTTSPESHDTCFHTSMTPATHASISERSPSLIPVIVSITGEIKYMSMETSKHIIKTTDAGQENRRSETAVLPLKFQPFPQHYRNIQLSITAVLPRISHTA